MGEAALRAALLIANLQADQLHQAASAASESAAQYPINQVVRSSKGDASGEWTATGWLLSLCRPDLTEVIAGALRLRGGDEFCALRSLSEAELATRLAAAGLSGLTSVVLRHAALLHQQGSVQAMPTNPMPPIPSVQPPPADPKAPMKPMPPMKTPIDPKPPGIEPSSVQPPPADPKAPMKPMPPMKTLIDPKPPGIEPSSVQPPPADPKAPMKPLPPMKTPIDPKPPGIEPKVLDKKIVICDVSFGMRESIGMVRSSIHELIQQHCTADGQFPQVSVPPFHCPPYMYSSCALVLI